MTFGRTFNDARRQQGFRSQAHLDSFMAAMDHKAGCADCQRPGESYWNNADCSWQPTVNECAEGKRMMLASFEVA